MYAIASEYDTALVGGDTTRWSRPLAIDDAITAEAHAWIDPITRAHTTGGSNPERVNMPANSSG